MPAQDTIHSIEKTALIKDGWQITHDPYTIQYDNTRVYADLGAEGDKIDPADEYRQIIERILHEHLEETPNQDNVETVALVDEKREHFLLIDMGWQLPRRVYSVVFHVWLKDGKFHVEQDWTEYGVARQLLDAGVPPEAIVLDFQPPNVRQLAHELMAA